MQLTKNGMILIKKDVIKNMGKMDEIKLKKIHDVIDCMNDIGMLDSYWEENIRIDVLDLDYRTR